MLLFKVETLGEKQQNGPIRNLLILYPISVLHARFRSSDTDLGTPLHPWEFPKPLRTSQNTSLSTTETAADVFFTPAAALWKRNSDEFCDHDVRFINVVESFSKNK